MKIISIVGARPQFIKAAAVSRVLRSTSEIEEVLVHTGQHYDENMSQVFFEELQIPKPDYNLGIGSGTHGAQTGRMLEAIEQVLMKEKPDSVLVYGDTNTTLAGALAGVKLHIPVAHVEAGLRSFNRRMPEEINRILTDHASDVLFSPTEAAVENLLREGIPEDRIHQVGDVMYDAAIYYAPRAKARSQILDHLELQPKGYILATVHRAENTDDTSRLRAIFEGLGIIAKKIPVLFLIHPRTRAALDQEGMMVDLPKHLHLFEPIGYLDMIMLEKNARLIATDSGGVQKEAFFYQVPCITLREETEWVELVELGWNVLVGCDPSRIAEAAFKAQPHINTPSLYGDGHAAERIVHCLLESH